MTGDASLLNQQKDVVVVFWGLMCSVYSEARAAVAVVCTSTTTPAFQWERFRVRLIRQGIRQA
jgi:hypothetical protein